MTVVACHLQRRQQQPALSLADGCGEALCDASRSAVVAGPAAIAAAAAAADAAQSGQQPDRLQGAHDAAAAAAALQTAAAVLWAQLRLLPHACAGPLQVRCICVEVKHGTQMWACLLMALLSSVAAQQP